MTLAPTLTASSDLGQRALDVGPLADKRSGYGESHGMIDPEVIDQLHAAGLLQLWVPAVLGGAELDPLHSLEVLENLSYADASTGWVVMAANLSIGTAGAFLADHAVAEIFGEGKRPCIAGQGTRPGSARQVDGGLSLSGSWSFGSGLLHSNYVHSLAIVEETGEPRICVTPIEQATLLGNWDVMGLQGTGSIDYSMDGVFVPDGWSHFAVTTDPLRGGDLYRIGIIGFAVCCHSGWAMGVGRRMLDELAAYTRDKAGRPGANAESTAFLQAYAEAEAAYRAARALVIQSWTELWDGLLSGEGIPVRRHTMIRLALAHITKTLHEVASSVYLSAGTTALRNGTLQRCFRDVHAGTQHVTSGPAVWQTCAREVGGLAPGQGWQFLDLVAAS